MKSDELIRVFVKCVLSGLALGVIFGPVIGWAAPELVRFFLGTTTNPVGTGLGLGIINGAFFGFLAAVTIAIFSRRGN